MTKVELYDPHPGFLGAAVPLPRKMKDLADSLEGEILTLEEVIERITPIAESFGGKVEVEESYIRFQISDENNLPMHVYRLIRYRKSEIR